MRFNAKALAVVGGALLLVGCVVREEPRRRVYVYDPPPPVPVEVVPVSPGPEYVWVEGGYVREGDHWGWHHGYWRR